MYSQSFKFRDLIFGKRVRWKRPACEILDLDILYFDRQLPENALPAKFQAERPPLKC